MKKKLYLVTLFFILYSATSLLAQKNNTFIEPFDSCLNVPKKIGDFTLYDKVYNPSFEANIYNKKSTPDYYHIKENFKEINTFLGKSIPKQDKKGGFIGLTIYTNQDSTLREYISIKLEDFIDANYKYNISCDFSNDVREGYSTWVYKIGVYFSIAPVKQKSTNAINVIPQYEFEFQENEINLTKHTIKNIIFDKNYKYVTIGFFSDGKDVVDVEKKAYYFIDNFSITNMGISEKEYNKKLIEAEKILTEIQARIPKDVDKGCSEEEMINWVKAHATIGKVKIDFVNKQKSIIQRNNPKIITLKAELNDLCTTKITDISNIASILNSAKEKGKKIKELDSLNNVACDEYKKFISSDSVPILVSDNPKEKQDAEKAKKPVTSNRPSVTEIIQSNQNQEKITFNAGTATFTEEAKLSLEKLGNFFTNLDKKSSDSIFIKIPPPPTGISEEDFKVYQQTAHATIEELIKSGVPENRIIFLDDEEKGASVDDYQAAGNDDKPDGLGGLGIVPSLMNGFDNPAIDFVKQFKNRNATFKNFIFKERTAFFSDKIDRNLITKDITNIAFYLKHDSSAVIELTGHTGNNMQGEQRAVDISLSKARVAVISNKLIEKGVNPEQIIAFGYASKYFYEVQNLPRKKRMRVVGKILDKKKPSYTYDNDSTIFKLVDSLLLKKKTINENQVINILNNTEIIETDNSKLTNEKRTLYKKRIKIGDTVHLLLKDKFKKNTLKSSHGKHIFVDVLFVGTNYSIFRKTLYVSSNDCDYKKKNKEIRIIKTKNRNAIKCMSEKSNNFPFFNEFIKKGESYPASEANDKYHKITVYGYFMNRKQK